MTEEKQATRGSIGDVAVLSVVAPILLDERLNEIMVKNAWLEKQNVQFVACLVHIQRLLGQCAYADAVMWYVLSDLPDDHPKKRAVLAQYPDRVAALKASEDNFVMGYYSGTMAVSNYIEKIIGAHVALARGETDEKEPVDGGDTDKKDSQGGDTTMLPHAEKLAIRILPMPDD